MLYCRCWSRLRKKGRPWPNRLLLLFARPICFFLFCLSLSFLPLLWSESDINIYIYTDINTLSVNWKLSFFQTLIILNPVLQFYLFEFLISISILRKSKVLSRWMFFFFFSNSTWQTILKLMPTIVL